MGPNRAAKRLLHVQCAASVIGMGMSEHESFHTRATKPFQMGVDEAMPASPPQPASTMTASPPWAMTYTFVAVAGGSVGDGTGTGETPWEVSTDDKVSGVFFSITSSLSGSGVVKRAEQPTRPPQAGKPLKQRFRRPH